MSKQTTTNKPVRHTVSPKGDEIRQLRQAKGWTQEMFAGKVGCPKRTIERVESGENCRITTLDEIATALGVGIISLIRWESGEDPSAFSREAPPIKASTNSIVVILPGTSGGKIDAMRNLETSINNAPGGGSEITALIWDWTEVGRGQPYGDDMTRAFRLWEEKVENELRGIALAHRLKEWASTRTNPHIYLVCSAAGCWAGVPTCERGDLNDRFFEKILLIDSTLDCRRDLLGLVRKQRQATGLYVYALKGSMISPLKLFGIATRTKPIGLPKNLPTTGPVKRLAWRREFVELGNKGDEWGAYADQFCKKFILPLFRPGTGTDPIEWEALSQTTTTPNGS